MSLSSLLLLATLTVPAQDAAEALTRAGAQPSAPCTQPAARAFDFWIGDWDVRQQILRQDGTWLAVPARTSVAPTLDGCALIERWEGRVAFFWEGMDEPAPMKGLSVRAFDPRAGKWFIHWMDTRSPRFGTPYAGNVVNGHGEFFREIETPAGPRVGRITFSALSADAVDWALAISNDGRETWQTLWTMNMQRVSSAPAEDSALEDLLRLHHDHRVSHVTGDAASLAATLADTLLDVGGGRVQQRTRKEAADRFEAYFAASTFLEWEDVRPPVVDISRDRTLAIVQVEKRVRVLSRAQGGTPAETAERFAWTETWRRGGDGWMLASTTSTRAAEPEPFAAPAEARHEASRVLRLAREAVGGHDAVARTAMVSFRADCEGPQGSFHTRVVSARDGRVRFEQDFPDSPAFGMGIDLDGGWQQSAGGERSDGLSLQARSVLHAHEMLLLAMAPEARYRAPFATGTADFHGRRAAVVRFADPLDAPVDFFYDVEHHRPLGFRLRNHTGRGAALIDVRYDDWRPVGQLRLPFAVTIAQGDEIYRYRLTDVDTNWVPSAGFEPAG